MILFWQETQLDIARTDRDSLCTQFKTIWNSLGFSQEVNSPTHKNDHDEDLTVTPALLSI